MKLETIGDINPSSRLDPDLAKRLNELAESPLVSGTNSEGRSPDVQDSDKNKSQNVQPVVQGISLDKLLVEASALRSQAGGDKDLLSYDASLTDLRSRGYNRHLRPDEVFRIMIDALENPYSQWKNVDADLLSSYGEWLSAYFQVSADGKELTVFLDPENLQWNGDVYVVDGNNGIVKGSSSRKFSLEKVVGKNLLGRAKTKNISLNNRVPLSQVNEINPELVEFLYTRTHDRLPDKIKHKGYLRLPEAGKGWPVGRGFDSNDYYLDAYYNGRASRGVR